MEAAITSNNLKIKSINPVFSDLNEKMKIGIHQKNKYQR